MESQANLPWYRQLHWQILVAMLAGVAVGLIGGEGIVPTFAWLGQLFVRLLKMVIVPLVFTSIVSGVASVGGGRDLGRLFGKTMGYYVLSSALAVLAGLLLVNIIQPGKGAQFTDVETKELPELSTPRHLATTRVRRSDLDHNGHLNSIVQLELLMEALPQEAPETLLQDALGTSAPRAA